MKRLLIQMIITISIAVQVFAADGDPVTITFDPAKKSVDLITGEKVTPCTQAQFGSVQFYMTLLHEPLEHITYFKEGVNTIPKSRLWKIVKEQEKWDIWRPWFKGEQDGYPLTQNIRTMAVSFVPLDPKTKAPRKKVTILLSDLNEIIWSKD